MGDQISRQAAIDAIEMLLEQSEDDEHDKTWNKAIRGSINAVKHYVPSAQPERWIPCSERLPEKHGEMYLVTISDGAVYSTTLQWDINRKRWYLSFLNNGEILIDYIDDVIAWRELPEPYKGD